MGWFKKLTGFSWQDKVMDPFTPESIKSTLDSGIMGKLGFSGKNLAETVAEASTGDTDVGRLTTEEVDTEMQKRMARLGRFFTSPMGVLNTANTASQKVFS